MTMKLRPHQVTALEKLRNGSVLYGGVGSGKSLVAAHYYMRNESPRPIFVITTARKRDTLDWTRTFAQYAIGTTAETTVAGVLTVDSWNNIGKYIQQKNAFFIFDEQRLVGSGGWVKSFLKIVTSNNWILLSGTPGDTWLEYIPIFVANGFYKNRTDFKARHVIYKSYTKFPIVDRYVDVGTLVRHRNKVLVHMPYEKHTISHVVNIPVEYDKKKSEEVAKTRWNPFKNAPMRGASEMFVVLRKITNCDESRLKAVQDTLKKHPKLIVFYNFDYELDILRTLEGIEIAEWNGHKHQELPESESWVYLVQYTAGAEAWECTSTNAIFFYSQVSSYKILTQAKGRIDRLNTKFIDLYYYKAVSSSRVDVRLRKILDEKRSFNQSDLNEFW